MSEIEVIEKFIKRKANLWIDYGKENKDIISIGIVNAVLLEYQYMLEFLKSVEEGNLRNSSKNRSNQDYYSDWG